MKTAQQTRYTPAEKAAMRKIDRVRGSRMLDVDAKLAEMAAKRMMREMD